MTTTTPGTESDWRSGLARFGLGARGVLYTVLGFLALQFAFGEASSQSVSKQGAIELVASQPFGRWLLGLLTLGLLALAAWQLITAVTGDPVAGSEASDRAKFAVKGALYLATAVSAAAVLAANWGASSSSGGSSGGGSSQDQAAAWLMDLPGGVWLVGALGVATVGFGLYQTYKHAYNAEFLQRLRVGEMSQEVKAAVKRAGQAGYGARGIVIAVIGAFFVVAALQHDPSESRGLSGSLKALAEQGWGPWVLAAVAAGLFLYGIFSFAEAYYRRAT